MDKYKYVLNENFYLTYDKNFKIWVLCINVDHWYRVPRNVALKIKQSITLLNDIYETHKYLIPLLFGDE